MADDNKLSFLLDLDVLQFTEKMIQAKGSVQQLGASENLSGLIEGLTEVAPIIAAAGTAAFAFKKALDFTVEGEEIERINKQFEILSAQAGIAPEKLKSGLENAAEGLVPTTDLLKIANEALVKMGGSAEKLPQLMEIAKKSTQVFGGTAKENFEKLTEAIANGNVRQLQALGINVDLVKAEKEFADANGITADELSKAGKQQAILNAALEQGEQRYKNIKVDLNSATTTIQALKTTVTELGETFTVVFEQTLGPKVRRFLEITRNAASAVKLLVQGSLGDATEAAAAKAELAGKTVEQVAKKEEKAAEDSIANVHKVTQASITDAEKVKKNQQAFRQEMDKIDKAYFSEQQKNMKTLEDIDTLSKKRVEINLKAHLEASEKIKNTYSANDPRRFQLLAEENKRFQAQMVHDEDDALKLRDSLLDNYVHHATSDFDGIERAFRANTIKMKSEMADFGKKGTETWNSLSSNATAAFTNMGQQMAQGKDIASATADAMRGFFLGFLGDQAIAQGKVMLLSGIWPPNPAAIAGGSALLVLGGILKGAAGPGAAGSTIGSAPSPSAVASGSAPSLAPISSGADSTGTVSGSSTATPDMASQQQPTRQVQVNIAGNYLETDSTKRMLMDLMRQESDATGFSYNQIGA